MGNIITKVFDEQEIEKTLIIPSDARETHSSTTLEGENIRTHQTFVKIQDGFEYCWDLEKVNGKIINIKMTTISLINSDVQYLVSTDDSAPCTGYFKLDDIMAEKFAKTKDIYLTPGPSTLELGKLKPKRRILL